MKFIYKIIISGIVAIILVTMLFSCGNEMQSINELPVKDTFPNEQATNITLYFSDSGMIEAKLTAPIMKRYNNENKHVLLPEGLFITFYDSIGGIESTLEADWGIRYEEQRKTEVKYDVVILTADSEEIYTDHLIWDEIQGMIFSDEFVKIVSPEKIIWGDGFQSDQRMDKYHIIRPKGEILVNDKENESE
jgi:LPS export ABC transporter protein LptC